MKRSAFKTVTKFLLLQSDMIALVVLLWLLTDVSLFDRVVICVVVFLLNTATAELLVMYRRRDNIKRSAELSKLFATPKQ